MDLTYIKQTGESNGDAGDKYIGLDRFGRVVDQRWIATGSGTALDRFQYGYERDSNPTFRDNLVNTAFGELYTYDGFNQLASFDRGTLNGPRTAISGSPARTQAWDYDALGNWDSVTTNGSAQTRGANAQNEITSISGATTPTYDANGNMTSDETGLKYVYDAWNRLVAVKNSAGTTTLKTYTYDGLNRRVAETVSGTTTDLYYSAGWQVLEERMSGSTTQRYVWSTVYVDGLILRDRDTDANGSLDERLWVQQDANWNVTALVNTSGSVVERYAYDPYGAVTVLNTSWSTISGSAYEWKYEFQGARKDATTGFNHFRRRDESPTLARPLVSDPLQFQAKDVNFYRWEQNRPVSALDPSGLTVYAQGFGFSVVTLLGGEFVVFRVRDDCGNYAYVLDLTARLGAEIGIGLKSGVYRGCLKDWIYNGKGGGIAVDFSVEIFPWVSVGGDWDVSAFVTKGQLLVGGHGTLGPGNAGIAGGLLGVHLGFSGGIGTWFLLDSFAHDLKHRCPCAAPLCGDPLPIPPNVS